jgi:serine/threonine-protein kinase
MSEGPAFFGRYAVFDEIAAGGMAAVHLAKLVGPVGFARTVAVKRAHAPFGREAEQSARLIDEARLAAAIHHPNVVSTLDVVTESDELLIVMEYVHGESLACLRDTGPVPVGIAAAIVAGTLHGLHAAHTVCDPRGQPLHLVHRDVSPQNILVGVDGVAKIADFGVAKALGRVQHTHAGQLKGKLAYMAPEQIEDGTIDGRTDVFAASVVLWELLTSKRLFAGATPEETSARVMSVDLEAPSRHAGGISPELDAIVLKGLAREPAMRFDSARAMALAIEEAVALPSPHEVGEWVATTATESLRERTEKLQRIEDLSGLSFDKTARTRAGETVPLRARAGKLSRWAAGGLSLVAAGSLAWLAFANRHGHGPRVAETPHPGDPAASTASPPPPPAPRSSDVSRGPSMLESPAPSTFLALSSTSGKQRNPMPNAKPRALPTSKAVTPPTAKPATPPTPAKPPCPLDRVTGQVRYSEECVP